MSFLHILLFQQPQKHTSVKQLIKISLICFLAVIFVSAPIHEAKSNTIVERIMKRWGKKNKLKKLGKRAERLGKDINLEEYSIKDGYDIIGMEPSWMINELLFEDHYFNLLSTLVVGEYDINPSTGAPRSNTSLYSSFEAKKRDKDAGGDVNILQRANFYNPKMNLLLRLTYSGDFGTKGHKPYLEKTLLSDKQVFSSMKDSLHLYFERLQAEVNINEEQTGVFVDFDITKTAVNLDNFVQFLIELKQELLDNQLLYVVVPANLRNNYPYPLDIIKKIDEIADCIVIDASGFEKYSKASPATVFGRNNDFSVDGTLKQYLVGDEDGERKSRFAVMLPYYGLKNYVDPNSKRASKSYITLDNFYKNVIGKSETIRYGKDTLYGKFEFDNNYYFVDDSKTFSYKYAYITDTLGINNVALNSLGYYMGAERIPQMWKSIALKYGVKRSTLFWTVTSYLMAFIPIGFMFSFVRYWEVRNALAKYNKYFARFVMLFVVFVFLYLTAANVVPRNTVGLIIGLIILGIFALYILIKKVLMRSKKYVNIVK